MADDKSCTWGDDTSITVALDITITDELKKEGIARDFVNRIQNMRKETGLEVQDKINISVLDSADIVSEALKLNSEYICLETQALRLEFSSNLENASKLEMDEFILEMTMTKA